MPAISAKKCTRQCANKLKKSTQILKIRPPSDQTTDSTPALHSTASPPSTIINFETFVELTDLNDIRWFCNAAASKGRNLKLLWDCAFEAGLNQGWSEERDVRDEMYLRGKAQGIKEVEEAASCAEIDLYCHRIVKGGIEERSKWTSAGHGLHCFSPIAILSDQIIQTDPVITPADSSDSNIRSAQLHTMVSTQTSTSSHLDISIQATEPPPSPSQPQKMTVVPLNWAEDANSLPIIPLSPSPRQPHDLSVLCSSSSSSPFSSLQHHSKHFNHYSHQPYHHYSHSRSNFKSFHSPYHNLLYKLSQLQFHTKMSSHLNWDSDPWLLDLSRSLKALGWIHAS